MKRLMLWNLLLAVCATAGIYELRRTWTETRAQQEVVLSHKLPAPKVNVPPPPATPAPFQAASYNDVAQKTLFSKDRNPNVEIVAPPPPPPPPPMPPLPHLYGVMGLPSGYIAIMSEKAGSEQKKVGVGDSIGDFKIAKLNTERITLAWMDKTVEKSIDQLLDRTPAPAAAAAPVQMAQANTNAPVAGPPVDPKMGVEIGAPGHSVRACKDQNEETSPEGTVVAGYVKHMENTPFGRACRWLQQ